MSLSEFDRDLLQGAAGVLKAYIYSTNNLKEQEFRRLFVEELLTQKPRSQPACNPV
jgi:hypothetical protein